MTYRPKIPSYDRCKTSGCPRRRGYRQTTCGQCRRRAAAAATRIEPLDGSQPFRPVRGGPKSPAPTAMTATTPTLTPTPAPPAPTPPP
ncbi:MAG: hypothetical protein ACI8RZ_007971, partial [Myxococcota bacterium]